MPTFYERNIWTFTLLLNNQPDLFSEQDRADLNDLDKVLTKDLEQISDAIENWQESRPKILKAHVKYFKKLYGGKPESLKVHVFDGKQKKHRGGPKGLSAPLPPSEAELRQQLTNAIRQNTSPASQPKKPEPDEKSK